eukprot:c18829_g1_i1 orf=75-2423(+)
MGGLRVSAFKKYLQTASSFISELGRVSCAPPLLERLVHSELFDQNRVFCLEPTPRSSVFPVSSSGSVLLEPIKLATSGSFFIRHANEASGHVRGFASCSGIGPDPHHADDLEDFDDLDLKGFDDNPEVLSHACKLAITISDSALEKFLVGCNESAGTDDASSQEEEAIGIRPTCGPSHVCLDDNNPSSSDPSQVRRTSHALTSSYGKVDIMSFLKECFESSPAPAAVALFVNDTLFPSAAPAFQGFFEQNCSKEFKKQLEDLGCVDVREKVFFPMFVDFCNEHYPKEMKRFQDLVQTADMSKPHTMYSCARSIKRKIIYHHGPTNSGKTYSALQRFLQEPNGIYCSPLRLLAMEVYDYANSKGVPCNLTTGQERKEEPLANHIACTVEMAALQQAWNVAVIDEVQLLNDDNRGWAWTRALLGLQAEEVHLCGDPSALAVVRSMCLATGDDLEEFSYERFKPLAVDTNTLNGDLRNVQPGDCIVAFSRREIFEIKRAVERATHKRCCVVYGALPPETRSQQAKLFNEPGNGYDILVASDAVGMGLNLNIKRVVFHTLEKFDGELTNPIPTSLTKQIAGRAGRRGSLYPEGLVTTLQASDLPHLFTCLDQPFVEACSAGLFPSCEQLQLFAKHMPDAKFSELLETFVQTSRVDTSYFLCQNRGLRKVAAVIDTVDNLTLEERFTFCFSPVNGRNPKSVAALLQYAKSYSQRLPLHLLVGRASPCPGIDYQLMDLEEKYQLLSLYLWLSQHFPAEFFPHIQKAQTMSVTIASTLAQSLADLHNSI